MGTVSPLLLQLAHDVARTQCIVCPKQLIDDPGCFEGTETFYMEYANVMLMEKTKFLRIFSKE